MTSFALRRSLPAMLGLLALLVGVGSLAVAFLGAPLFVPPLIAGIVLGLQYALGPWFLDHLVKHSWVEEHDGQYAVEGPLGTIVARRCAEAGLKPVRLSVIDDGTPNAFTYGHHRGDARVCVSRGLLERLDEHELDAVVTHELGHVRNNDVIVMTLAAGVPILLYYLYAMLRSNNRGDTQTVAIATYVGYLLSQLVVLALGRARESSADHFSCEMTGEGDALATALIKVAYGIGEVKVQQGRLMASLKEQGKSARKQRAALQRRRDRMGAMGVLGIADARSSASIQLANSGMPWETVRGALRWEVLSPWARVLEKLCSHPLTARRIVALGRSGLPGAPIGWAALADETAEDRAGLAKVRRQFLGEVAIMVAPWVALVAGAGVIAGADVGSASGAVIALAGLLFFAKQLVRYPFAWKPQDHVTALLDRLDASPMRGIAVSLRGRVVGRAMPGYRLSSDLVVADESGFVPVLYRQPLGIVNAIFALAKAGRYEQQEVLVRGWYRRGPGPMVELYDIVAADGTRSRSWEYGVKLACAIVVTLVGVVMVLHGLTA